MVFTWDPSLETHLDEVDAQHRRLVELINALGQAIADGGEGAPPDLAVLHEQLTAYAARHFADEERLMAAEGIDERHRARHKRQHRDFRAYVRAAQQTGEGGSAEQARSLMTYLVHWLTYHILEVDQSLARQLHAVRAGATAAAAFEAEHEGRSGASGLLLRSVGELLDLLSARNRELVDVARTLEQRVAQRTEELTAANRELRAMFERVEHMAMTDALTGLPNRRYAMDHLARAWSTAARYERDVACLLVDADHFKQVNDSFRHEAGDAVLIHLARSLRAAVREGDQVCRLGGDEFLVLCPETTLEGALAVGERVRAQVAAQRVEVAASAWTGTVTVSVGAAARHGGMGGAEELLRAADAALFEAKRGGRNRVAAARPG